MKKDKKIFSFFEVSIIVIVSSFIMSFLGAALIYKHLGGVNFSLLDEDSNLQEFIGAYNNLLDNYYDDLDKSDLIDGAISGMYEITGDPYTTYLDQDSSDTLDSDLNGKYEGIGISMIESEDGHLVIYEVYEDSPAHKAGLLIGDIITKLDGEDVTSEDSSSIAEKIMSSKSVTLTINRDGQEKDFTLSIGTVMIPVVSSHTFNQNGKNIGYLRLYKFSDTADVQFTDHLSKLENTKIDSLIIDLRDNTGGYLQVAQNIAEMFLAKGKIIYSLESKTSKETTMDETSEKRDYKIAILINGNSASASEILAGALKHSYGATLIGGVSYGKGKVQERSTLSSGTALKYTTAEWLLPNGECLDGVGLQPDIMIDLIYEGFDPNNLYTDNQVMEAVKYLAE